MGDLVNKAYQKITSNPEFASAVALTWSNLPRSTFEQLSGTDPQVSANSMAYATAIKIIVGPAYEFAREKGMNHFKKKGLIKQDDPNDGKKTFDRTFGPAVALIEGSVNAAAYYLIYGEQNIGRAFLNGFASAITTSFGNFNGKAIDTMLELNNLPNEGRGFVPKSTSPERKKELKQTIETIAVTFPLVYYLGTQAASYFAS